MKHLSLRLGDDLHARVKDTAEADKRTLNAQVEWLLEAGLEARERGGAVISLRGLVLHHKDGNPYNNDLDNLELVDPKENRL